METDWIVIWEIDSGKIVHTDGEIWYGAAKGD